VSFSDFGHETWHGFTQDPDKAIYAKNFCAKLRAVMLLGFKSRSFKQLNLLPLRSGMLKTFENWQSSIKFNVLSDCCLSFLIPPRGEVSPLGSKVNNKHTIRIALISGSQIYINIWGYTQG